MPLEYTADTGVESRLVYPNSCADKRFGAFAMAETTSKLPPPSAWQAEAMRMTVFLAEGSSVDTQRAWTRLSGEDPEQHITNPKQATSQTMGILDGNRVIVAASPLRVNWILAGEEATEQPEKAADGPLPEVVGKFTRLMAKWVPESPSATRVAFGTVLLQYLDSREDGYRRIDEYLPAL